MSDEYYDEDGFRLEFEDDTVDQEKQFFMRAFPNVNKIAERKVHCTSCYMHIGTAPITEAVIRMHPILRVTHCRNCHTFYNSGEFDKGEDGSELYCRWCGQGGEVYCCSKCPYVFCKKCIVQNLSRACVQDISRNDNWQCFSCAPKIMWHLRAQHWALVNYIEKQKKEMKDKNLSVQTINNLMKQDNTTCCSNKGLNKKGSTPVSNKKGTKRPSEANEITSPGAAKIPENKRILPRPVAPPQQANNVQPAPKKMKTDNNEVVCTPDIMSMFMNPEEPPPLVAATRTPPTAKPPAPKPTPAPAVPTTVPGRQVVVRPAVPANANPVSMRMPVPYQPSNIPPPVYHTINGYRIDLHTAAQQGTYRLPNGKLIQVRKQAPAASPATTPTPTQPPSVAVSRNIAPKPTNSAYFNAIGVSPNPPTRMTNGGTNMNINMALQHQQQLQEQRLQQQRQQQQQQQQMLQQRQQQLMIQQAQVQAQSQVGQPTPTIVAGQPNPALQLPTLALLQNMVNGPHEDSPLGKSRKNFEGKLLSGVEICQHIVNKINTLTNSNSFKNIRNVRDLKELYIHVSYLLTYAIGRFKTLQEKCVDDVKKMGFTKESDFVMMGEQISNRNPDEDKSDDEDDCEIIEQNTTLIELDSEDEEDSSGKKKKGDGAQAAAPCSIETEAAVAAILQEREEANAPSSVVSVDSMPQITAVEGNVSLEKIDSMATDSSAEKPSTEDNTNEIVEVSSAAETDKSKNDKELVEIVDGDENETSKNKDSTTQPKENQDDVVEIIEDEDEQQEKDDKVKDTTNEAGSAMEAEEKSQDKGSMDVDADPQIDSAEGKQESFVTVLVETEETSKEDEDVELVSAEVEQPSLVESVDGAKTDENDNKENESPVVEADVSAKNDIESNTVEGDKLEEPEVMEVDAQKGDNTVDKSSSSKQVPEKCAETEDAPVSPEDRVSESIPVSDSEQGTKQSEDNSHVNEAEELKISAVESQMEPLVNKTLSTEDDVSENPEAEEISTEIPTENSASCSDVPDAPSSEDIPAENETPATEISAVEQNTVEKESDMENVPKETTGNDLLSQIEDSFQKLEEMIASTEDVAEVQNSQQLAEHKTPADEEQMETDDGTTVVVPEENGPSEELLDCLAQSAEDAESNDVSMIDNEKVVKCNGVLHENGTSTSSESQDALENASTTFTKQPNGDVECVNLAETINGDC